MRVFVVFVTLVVAVCVISVTALGQGGFAPGMGGSGIDMFGIVALQRHQDSAYGTAAGALVDYGGIPLNEAGRLWALAGRLPG